MEDLLQVSSNLGFVAAIFAVVISILSLVLSTRQYILNYHWNRSKFSADVVEKFYTDEKLILARSFIDWNDRMIVLPLSFSPDGKEPYLFAHTIPKLSVAMSAESRATHPLTGQFELREEFMTHDNMIYVEVFDRFIDYVTQLKYFLDSGLITENDITPLSYILTRFWNTYDGQGSRVFESYLTLYRLHEVIDIIDLCGRGISARDKRRSRRRGFLAACRRWFWPLPH